MNTEQPPSTRHFLLGCLAVTAVIAGLVLLVAAFGTRTPRPEGIAERWLTDVGDTTRSGVAAQARKNADRTGPASLAAELVAHADAHGKSAFRELEVGKAAGHGDTVRVPFSVQPRSGTAVHATITLTRTDGSWHVIAVSPTTPGGTVPGQAGELSSRAALTLFSGALITALMITVAASALVHAAGRPCLRRSTA